MFSSHPVCHPGPLDTVCEGGCGGSGEAQVLGWPSLASLLSTAPAPTLPALPRSFSTCSVFLLPKLLSLLLLPIPSPSLVV